MPGLDVTFGTNIEKRGLFQLPVKTSKDNIVTLNIAYIASEYRRSYHWVVAKIIPFILDVSSLEARSFHIRGTKRKRSIQDGFEGATCLCRWHVVQEGVTGIDKKRKTDEPIVKKPKVEQSKVGTGGGGGGGGGGGVDPHRTEFELDTASSNQSIEARNVFLKKHAPRKAPHSYLVSSQLFPNKFRVSQWLLKNFGADEPKENDQSKMDSKEGSKVKSGGGVDPCKNEFQLDMASSNQLIESQNAFLKKHAPRKAPHSYLVSSQWFPDKFTVSQWILKSFGVKEPKENDQYKIDPKEGSKVNHLVRQSKVKYPSVKQPASPPAKGAPETLPVPIADRVKANDQYKMDSDEVSKLNLRAKQSKMKHPNVKHSPPEKKSPATYSFLNVALLNEDEEANAVPIADRVKENDQYKVDSEKVSKWDHRVKQPKMKHPAKGAPNAFNLLNVALLNEDEEANTPTGEADRVKENDQSKMDSDKVSKWNPRVKQPKMKHPNIKCSKPEKGAPNTFNFLNIASLDEDEESKASTGEELQGDDVSSDNKD